MNATQRQHAAWQCHRLSPIITASLLVPVGTFDAACMLLKVA